MFKKILLTFITLNLFCIGFAQIKTPIEFIGKNKGKIKVILRQEEPFVAGRTFARVLGMKSTAYGASGRLELTEGSKTALLENKKPYVFINKQKKNLSQTPFKQDSTLYVPLSFFTQFSSYDIAYIQNKIIVERKYTLAFKEQKHQAGKSQIFFRAKGELPFKIEKSTKDKVNIFFPGAIVKRDEIISSKNDFLSRIRISQKKKGVQIVALLKKNAKHWDFYYNGKYFIFEMSSSAIKRSVGNEDTQEDDADNIIPLPPSVLQEGQYTQKEDEDIIELGEEFFTGTGISVEDTFSQKVSLEPKILPASTILPLSQNKGKLKILIDPGHGGKDPGATRKGSAKEKELNLKVARQVYNLLKKEKNIEVKMTRNDDTFVSLGDRARMSVKQDSDIFVSIHTNAAKKGRASGFEVYFRSDKASDAEAAQTAALENEALQYEGQTTSGLSFTDLLLQSLATNENINQSSKLAAHIRLLASKDSAKTGIKVFNNSAIKQANFYVLKGVKCPAVLVEMGYISNASDRKRLNNKNTQTLVAKIIAKGILTYAKEEGWK